MRLGGVTQVISPDREDPHSYLDPDSLVNNRMTHSLRVAQVARSIAIRLISPEGDNFGRRHELILRFGGLDADVAAVAGLAHDLGHPPFGHAAETALDELARTEFGLTDGFEGNAQSLRIVSRMEAVSSKPGMDLTRATLAAIIKYPWIRRGSGKQWKKFNAYNSEEDVLDFSRGFLPDDYPPEQQTLEASIMDIADDISYAFHDLEDFHLAGLLPQDRILALLADGSDFLAEVRTDLGNKYGEFPFSADFDEAVIEAEGIIQRVTRADVSDPARVGKTKHACAGHIGKFIADVDFPVNNPEQPYWPGGPLIGLDVKPWTIIQILKAITKKEVIDTPLVQDDGAQGAECVKILARKLREALEGGPIPPPKRLQRMVSSIPVIDDAPKERLRRIIDYICTLTDKQARTLSQSYSSAVVGAGAAT